MKYWIAATLGALLVAGWATGPYKPDRRENPLAAAVELITQGNIALGLSLENDRQGLQMVRKDALERGDPLKENGSRR